MISNGFTVTDAPAVITHYNRRGVSKRKTNCYSKSKDGVTAFYSYGTIIGFCNYRGDTYFRKGSLSTTTSQHLYRLRNILDQFGAPLLPKEEFWGRMIADHICEVFDYSGSFMDMPPEKPVCPMF